MVVVSVLAFALSCCSKVEICVVSTTSLSVSVSVVTSTISVESLLSCSNLSRIALTFLSAFSSRLTISAKS